MASHILEMMLSNLPLVLSLWTALSLSWGLYVMVSFQHMIKYMSSCGGCRVQDHYNVNFMAAANIALASFLILEPILASSIGDAVIVLNTFYSVYLVPTSISLAKWWRVKSSQAKPATVNKLPDDHLLT